MTISLDYSYVVYYQSRDGVSHSVAFTSDSREDHTHELTGLPVVGIHSISLLTLIHLPSPVVGPVTPGEHTLANLLHSQLSGYSVVEAPVVVVSGEGSGEVGTSYSLTCRVTLPLGVAGVSPNIQWKRPNMPYTPSTPDNANSRQFHTTLELNALQSTDAGEYICQASYSLGGYTSPLVRDSLALEVISKSY